MKHKWIAISALTALGIVAVLGIGAASIAAKIDYEVLSYQVQILDSEGITIRVIFGIINPSGFDVDIWNQKYDVFVAGYNTMQILSEQSYRILAGTTSPIAIDVRLTWEQIAKNAQPIGSYASAMSYQNLPIVIKGTLSARSGFLRLKRIPVRMAAPLSYFLP